MGMILSVLYLNVPHKFCCVLCLQQPDGGGSYGSMGFTAVELARKAHHDLPN